MTNSNEITRWFKDRGDYTHNVTYDLTEDSIIMDLGGYTGVWAQQMIEKYNPNVYILEPLVDFYEGMVKKFSNNSKVHLMNVGVGIEDKDGVIYMDGDASSTNIIKGQSINVKFNKIKTILNKWGLDKIDLIQINIEGDEYVILEQMIQDGTINKFKNIQVQFHLNIENAVERRNKIRSGFESNGFKNNFDYPFVWESWGKKKTNMIYIVGDSHGQSFDDSYIKLWLDAPTAYQNIKKIPEIENFLSSNNIDKDKDFIFFSFGEIDVRCHLGFVAEKHNRTYDDVVSECVERYGLFLDHFINTGYKVGVWGPIPSGSNNGIQGNGAMSYKTKKERNLITQLFNIKLEEMSKIKNIQFKTLFYDIVNDINNYDEYFSTDNIHLNSGRFKTKKNNIHIEEIINFKFKDLLL